MHAPIKKPDLALPWLALVSLVLAASIGGASLQDFSHRTGPLALLGARGIAHAGAFNLFAYLLPGALLFFCGNRLHRAWRSRGSGARIGVSLAQVSALAFAAQGLLPLDPGDLDGAASRLHAAAWMLWWLAAGAALLLLAWSLRRARGFAVACVALALALVALAVLLPTAGWSGLAQRLAFAAWVVWWMLAMRQARRAG